MSLNTVTALGEDRVKERQREVKASQCKRVSAVSQSLDVVSAHHSKYGVRFMRERSEPSIKLGEYSRTKMR